MLAQIMQQRIVSRINTDSDIFTSYLLDSFFSSLGRKFVFAPICRGVAAKRAAAGGLSSFFPEGREQAPVDR